MGAEPVRLRLAPAGRALGGERAWVPRAAVWAEAADLRPLPRRLQGALEPGRGGGAAREGVCVPGGLLQAQVPRAAGKVSPSPASLGASGACDPRPRQDCPPGPSGTFV